MNSQGFTLIELTAIIVVLAAIFLVSFPTLLNVTKKDSDNQYEKMKDDLCLAGKSYIYSNLGDFDEISTIGSEIKIQIQDLIEYGSIEDRINVNTQKSISKDLLIYTVLEDYTLDCKYNEKG